MPDRNDRVIYPGLGCFDAQRPDFKPRAALTAGAEAPPDDGFHHRSGTRFHGCVT